MKTSKLRAKSSNTICHKTCSRSTKLAIIECKFSKIFRESMPPDPPKTVTVLILLQNRPALGVSVKSVHLVTGRLGFYSQSDHTKDFKNSIRSFRARRSAQAEVRRALCMCCSTCMSLNSVQSFVIENCNGPTFENGLNQGCATFFTGGPLSKILTTSRASHRQICIKL